MLIIGLGRLIQFVILLATLRVATSILPPEEMGKISIVTGFISFFALFLLYPVGMFMNRRLLQWNQIGIAKKYFKYFFAYLFIVTLVSGCLLAILFGLSTRLDDLFSMKWLVFLVCGNLIFATINQVSIPGLNLIGSRGIFVILTILTYSLSLGFGVILSINFGGNAEYWLSGILIGQVVIGLVGLKLFFAKLKNDGSKRSSYISLDKVKNLYRFAWPLSLAAGLSWIQSQSYRYQMEEFLGLEDLGLFFSGYIISIGLIAGFDSIISAYFLPIFYKKLTDPALSNMAWRQYAHVAIPSLLITGFLIIATAPELAQLLLGAKYQAASQFIIFGAICEVSRVASGVYGLAAHAHMQTRKLLYPNLISAIATIFLVWFFMPIYGTQGIGIALILSSMIFLLLSALEAKKIYENIFFYKSIKNIFIGGFIIVIFTSVIRGIYGENEKNLVLIVDILITVIFFTIAQLYILFRDFFDLNKLSASEIKKLLIRFGR